MLKRVLFVLCIVILVITMAVAAINIIECCNEPRLESDILPTPAWLGVVYPWGLIVFLLFEILYNIMYFFVYKVLDTNVKSRLNFISLILAVLHLVSLSSLLILFIPIFTFAYIVVRMVYVVLVIKDKICERK